MLRSVCADAEVSEKQRLESMSLDGIEDSGVLTGDTGQLPPEAAKSHEESGNLLTFLL
jgi:hypothetical protein